MELPAGTVTWIDTTAAAGDHTYSVALEDKSVTTAPRLRFTVTASQAEESTRRRS